MADYGDPEACLLGSEPPPQELSPVYQEELRACLGLLPQTTQVILYRSLEGESQPRISEHVGICQSAVCYRLHAARAWLAHVVPQRVILRGNPWTWPTKRLAWHRHSSLKGGWWRELHFEARWIAWFEQVVWRHESHHAIARRDGVSVGRVRGAIESVKQAELPEPVGSILRGIDPRWTRPRERRRKTPPASS